MSIVDPHGSHAVPPPSESSDSSPRTQALEPHRVVVVDDHELLRTGTRRILEETSGFTVVGEAEDGEAALRVIADTEPDVVLVDIRLPTINGIDLARQIVAERPSMTVLILSAYDDEHYVRESLAAGVSGYLLKTMPSDELVRSIRDACDGTGLTGSPAAWRGEKAAESVSSDDSPRLTAREQEVVRLGPGACPTRPSPTSSASAPERSKATSITCSTSSERRHGPSWSTSHWPAACSPGNTQKAPAQLSDRAGPIGRSALRHRLRPRRSRW